MGAQVNKITNERGENITETTDIRRITKNTMNDCMPTNLTIQKKRVSFQKYVTFRDRTRKKCKPEHFVLRKPPGAKIPPWVQGKQASWDTWLPRRENVPPGEAAPVTTGLPVPEPRAACCGLPLLSVRAPQYPKKVTRVAPASHLRPPFLPRKSMPGWTRLRPQQL